MTLKDNMISCCYTLFIYVADPATFLASNSFLGPYFPLRTASLFSYGRNKCF